MRKRLFTGQPHQYKDITGLAIVAVYVILAFLILLAWYYLSREANALVNDAQRHYRQELSDAVQVGQKFENDALFGGEMGCGLGTTICQELKTI